MDAALITALEAAAPTEVLFVTVSLPSDVTIRWTNGGFAEWDGETYQAEDATYGLLSSVEEITDGVTGEATVCALTIDCDATALALLVAPTVQGSLVTVHLGAVNRSTGALIGEPELLFRGELDQPRLSVGEGTLVYDCITEEARMLEPNEEQRLTDSFHKSVWPGDLGYANVVETEAEVYWRQDDPRNPYR